MTKIKNFPFCGKYPQTVVDDETEELFGVKCFNCGGSIFPEKNDFVRSNRSMEQKGR